MADIPVFDGGKIIGYLDSDEIPEDLLRSQLRWDLVGSQRPATSLYADRGQYRAFVLVVDGGIADFNNIKHAYPVVTHN